MRKMVIVVMSLVVGAAVAFGAASINWATDPSGQYLRNQADTAYLTANQNGQSLTGFIQLLYLGPNNVYDGLYVGANTNGVMGDDRVVMTAWVGAGYMTSSANDGKFQMTGAVNTYPLGAYFAIRFFDTPASDYANGFIPTSGYYSWIATGLVNGAAGAFISTQDPTGVGIDEFVINTVNNANILVPEPSTMLLALCGLGALFVRRFRK